MPQARGTTHARPGRTRRVLRGLGALVALVIVIAGVPALLIALGAYPHTIPAPHTVWTTLTTRDDGQLIYGVLAAGVWICWALFTLATIDELIASMRGRTVPHLPALGAFQRPAAGLISAVLLMFAATPLVSAQPHAEATPTAGPSVTTAENTATATRARPAPPAEQADHPRSTLTYQVARYDTLWKIARDHLGDPLRYREIGDLNRNRIGPDNELVPGTVLDMPADATGLTRPLSPDIRVTGPGHPATVVVRPPRDGVHDSLWRIAERTLGNGARWPEIFALNKGMPQPAGHTFTRPSLIFPGETLKLPSTPSIAPEHDPVPRQPPPTATPHPSHHHASQRSRPPRPDGRVATTGTRQDPRPTNGARPDSTTPREHGVSVGSELFVGVGVAAAVSGALAVARRRYRRRYVPGSGDRTDLPLAPAIYQLRMAHLRTEHDSEDNHRDNDSAKDRPELITAPGPEVLNTSRQGQGAVFAPALGIRDGREVALDLAAARGLGLVGAGGVAAARALLIAALARADGNSRPHRGINTLIPATDLAILLGDDGAQAPLPAAVQVVATLADALDTLEAETLTRAGTNNGHDPASGSWPTMMLVTQPDAQQQRRLQAVLDNGSTVGIAGLLLGRWPAGITAHVRADGMVATTNTGSGEPLHRARLFHLGEAGAADLLTLLHKAQPDAVDRVHDHAVPPPGDSERPPATITTAHTTGDHAGSPRPTLDLEMTAAAGITPTSERTLEITGPSPAPPRGTARRRATTSRAQHRSSSPATPSAPTATATITPGRRSSPKPAVVLNNPATPSVRVRITVLGPPRIWLSPKPGPDDSVSRDEMQREVTGAFQPRTRELLVFLAVHPDGASREALIGALWSDNPSVRSTNSLNTALSRLRRAVITATDDAFSELVIVGEDRYRLDPTLVSVDYWRFDAAVTARRAATTEQQRVEAYREIVNAYSGPLADGLSAEWIETAREAIRRDAIDAVAALARATVAQDPHQTLDLLEVARAFDPHNEALYRDIMRLQYRLGRYDAIARTLTLLTTRLAEINDRPTTDTIDLVSRLRSRPANTPHGDRARPLDARGRSATK